MNRSDLGHSGDLFILAFDHRGSFKKKMFGIEGREPTNEEHETLRQAKRLVWEGFLAARDQGLPEGAGILVDEEMGAAVAREAAELGVPFAMPVEKSGQPVFDFEYGEDFGKHIEDFDPTFSKVLVRWNPDDPPDEKQEQAERLARLGDWLHDNGRLFLFELLVPASERQLALVGGDAAAYDSRVRPVLMLETIAELHAAGVEPDIWKIEGIDTREDCELIAGLTRSDGRDAVASVVLGRGADDDKVDHWLRQGAPVPGYAGFAIGRSIWWSGVEGWKNGTVERDAAAGMIGDAFRRFIDVYTSAA
jgi:myo-inositol catabolism protein IolC